MNERMCKAVVKILEESTIGELSQLCVEILHSVAANGKEVNIPISFSSSFQKLLSY